jgi:D-glycero-alpha-D-manno-heptose-7-phosphate kinase
MIITRSPLRITLGGGGTDLPSYYEKHCGFLMAAAIDRYVYITLHQTFEQQLILKYSEMERVHNIDEVKHPIIREALRMMEITEPRLEITSMADIPARTGLGSSGSFTTALLKALHSYKRSLLQPHQLAEQACEIEMNRLKEPVGKQDQYIAAYGGITCFRFMPDGRVEAWPLKLADDTRYELEENLLLFFTGFSRSASAVLKDQDERSKTRDTEMMNNLHFIKELGMQTQEALEKGDLREFANLMHVHWEKKRARSTGISNDAINQLYDHARANGALGGKLVGAGGGGFLLLYAEDKRRLREAMREKGLEEVRFRFDLEGTKVVAQ